MIDNLRDIFVSEGDGTVMSSLCSIFDPSFISSSTPPTQETLTTLISNSSVLFQIQSIYVLK